MRSNLFLLSAFALLLMTSCASRKKPKLRSESVPVAYLKYPKTATPEKDKRTFSARVYFSEESKYGRDDIVDMIEIAGFKRQNEDAQIKIKMDFDDIIVDDFDIKNRTTSNKDREGNVTKTTKYWLEVDYRSKMSYTVHSSYGLELNERDNLERTFKSSEFSTYSKARDYYRHNFTAEKRRIQNDYVKAKVDEVNLELENRFGYTAVKSHHMFYNMKNEKHAEYDGFHDAHRILNQQFSSMHVHKPVATIKEELKDLFTYYKEIADRYEGEEKQDQKMRFGALYNLGYMHYYLDEFDKANEYAQLIQNCGHSEADGRRLAEKIIETKERLKASKAENRHPKEMP